MDDSDFETVIGFAERHSLNKAIYYTLWYLNQIYHDGYEQKILERIRVENTDFLYTFGKTDETQTQVWKKNFWERLFSGYNLDEILED